MYTISNSWKMFTPICGCHKEKVEMKEQEGPYSVFYACPRYKEHAEDEKACNNRINQIDYEKMITKLCDMIAETEMRNEKINLTNYSWSSNGIEFNVISHKPKKIKVAIKNNKADDYRIL